MRPRLRVAPSRVSNLSHCPSCHASSEGLAQFTALIDQIAQRELPEGKPLGTFVALADKDGKVSADVPVRWQQQEVTNWLSGDEPVGIALIAAEDESRYFNTSSSPGVFLGVADDLPGDGTAETFAKRAREHLVDKCVETAGGGLTGESAKGFYSVWTRCGSTDSMTVHYVSVNEAGYGTAADLQLIDQSDVASVDRVLRTLTVDPPVGIAGRNPADNDTFPGQVIP